VKIAVVGGGGFRTPVIWESVAELDDVAGMTLHDHDRARLERIAPVIEGLRRERGGGGPSVRTTTSLEDAVEGCGAVFCAIRVGGLEGRVVDETVPLALGVLGQETVGPGGIAFALRTVPVMREIAEVTAKRAPGTWFLNFTNPAGLVTEAIRPILGDRAIGVCDSPAALCARVAAALGKPMRSLEFAYAGLNHLGWLAAVHTDGEEVLGRLLDDEPRLSGIEEARLFGPSSLRELGAIPNEYLVYYERPDDIVRAFRAAGQTRAQVLLEQQHAFYAHHDETPEAALSSWRLTRDARHGSYMAEAWAAGHLTDEPAAAALSDDEGPGEAGYAAIAASFLHALTSGPPSTLILNTPNRGRLPFLDDEAVIEAPCEVTPSGVRGLPGVELGERQRELVERMKQVDRLTIRAAIEGSAALALAAIATHPLVPSHEVAERIFDGYLAGHPELRARLS
jgi:6-phospho-beta-glucosidase